MLPGKTLLTFRGKKILTLLHSGWGETKLSRLPLFQSVAEAPMRFRGFFEHKLIIAKEIQQRIDDSAGLGINASALYNYQVPTDRQTKL